MTKKKEKEKSLPELISEKQIKIVQPFLELAYLKRELPELTLLDPRPKDEIIKEIESQPFEQIVIEILSDMVLNLAQGTIQLIITYPDSEIRRVGLPALEEISKIYHIAIKGVGISSKKAEKYPDLPQEYRTRALEYFDKQPNNFKYVKRKFLEEGGLYGFSQGKEWRDFQTRILNKVIKDKLGLKIGGQAILRIIQKEKTD